MLQDASDEVIVKWSDSSGARIMYGEGLHLDLRPFGCSEPRLEDRALCFLQLFPELFGIDDPASLSVGRKTSGRTGLQVLRFLQNLDGVPVWDSDVIASFDLDGSLTRVVSHYKPTDLLARSSREALAARVQQSDPAEEARAVRASSTYPLGELERSRVFYVVNDTTGTLEWTPARLLEFSGEDGGVAVTVEVGSGRILQQMPRRSNYAAKPINWTRVAFEGFTSTSCPLGICSPPPLVCSSEMSPDKCVNRCSTDAECTGAYSGWKCWVTDPAFPGYCYRDRRTVGTQDLLIYNQTAWTSSAYSYHSRYADLLTKVNDVIAFHYDDLGRAGWDDANGNYNTVLNSHCCWSGDPDSCISGTNCPAGSADGFGNVDLNAWAGLAPTSDIDFHNAGEYDILGHEWAHNIVLSEAGYWLGSADCLNENVVDLFGALLAVKKVGDSSTQWTNSWCAVPYAASPWTDEAWGLVDNECGSMPFSQRSRFDWLDCANPRTFVGTCSATADCRPYEACRLNPASGTLQCTNAPDVHNNAVIWNRFARVLAEGTGTFANDSNSENVGIASSAVGLATATDVIYEATLNAQPGLYLEEWVDLLLSAGVTSGVSSQVRTALGVVGFVSLTGTPVTGSTLDAPERAYFDAWSPSSVKYFYAWKSAANNDILLSYRNALGPVTDTIAANTNSSPTMVIYNSRLYLLWQDRTTWAVKYKYYTSSGGVSATYDLGSIGVSTPGAFDATVFNNKLYLVWVNGATNNVMLAWCSSAFPCTSTSWHDFGGGVHTVDLGYDAYVGLGIDAGAGLHGTASPSSQHLYIVAASQGGANDRRIRIDQVSTSDVLQHSSSVVWLPDHYPSYKTQLEVGAKLVDAAFPVGKYLYLTWRDLTTTRIFKAVVQTYDDATPTQTWITRSDDTFLDSYTGVRFMKGTSSSVDSVVFVHTEPSFGLRYSLLYGRY